VLYTFPPGAHTFYPPCLFHAITGFDCPGCGTTRALHHLLHGRVAEAFRLNPMVFAGLGLFGFSLPSLARGERPRFVDHPWFGWTAIAVLMVWWIARNL
jgi:hypothetical protein